MKKIELEFPENLGRIMDFQLAKSQYTLRHANPMGQPDTVADVFGFAVVEFINPQHIRVCPVIQVIKKNRLLKINRVIWGNHTLIFPSKRLQVVENAFGNPVHVIHAGYRKD